MVRVAYDAGVSTNIQKPTHLTGVSSLSVPTISSDFVRKGETGESFGRSHGRGSGRSTIAPAITIFADRAYLRAELTEDAVASGFRLAHVGDLGSLQAARDEQGDTGLALGELVLVDYPIVADDAGASLTRLAKRAAQSGATLVVSTSLEALDAVFGCLGGFDAEILVSPSRAERMTALARAKPLTGNRARVLSEADRVALLALTEEVGQMVQKLQRLTGSLAPVAEQGAAFRFQDRAEARRTEDGSERLLRTARAALPDPRLVRRIIRQRQLRARFFEGELFADPAWDMLLDLTAARAEHTRVSVKSLCIASGVPLTTALRWISQMTDAGLLERTEDELDRRRAFLSLTDKAAEGMANYFAELGPTASTLV